jgi:alpha-beta hydrolase superfamily lysophospholipase
MIWLRRIAVVAAALLAVAGLAAIALGALLAFPVSPPAPLESIRTGGLAIDWSGMPDLSYFQARDGSSLAYRVYPAANGDKQKIAILIHGSGGHSTGMNGIAKKLAAENILVVAPDIRGHGASGTRGDIAYVGQLDDDLADFVTELRKVHPTAPLTLIGHSSGGGFVLRIAGSPIQNLFARTVLLAPYLGYYAPSSRPNAGGWASADVPRFIALELLHRFGLPIAQSLPVIAFAVPPNSARQLTATYSWRLLRDFGASADYRRDFAGATRPIAIFAGADDELIRADRLRDGAGDRTTIGIIDGVDHMGIVCDPAALSVIADDVATTAWRS